MIDIHIKKLTTNAIIPSQKYKWDAGFDLYAVDRVIINPFERKLVRTGIAMSIPEGYYGRIAPRSGLALKNGIDVMAGVIDHSYTDEIGVLLINFAVIGEPLAGQDAERSIFGSKNAYHISPGDRIAQIIFEKIESANFIEVDNLKSTDRTGGYGSTGR
jgi:dUTP pyrophosphatase